MREALDFLQTGGWPMIPLAICSVAALTVIIERFYALRRGHNIPKNIVDVIDRYQGEGSVESTIQACRRSSSALARMLEELILARRQTHAHIVESLNATGRREVERLERGMIILEIVAGISPLIGLLGTVLGMVTVFDAISTEGLGNAQVLSSGISEALVTTITGLSIGIPALALHTYFARRVDSIAIELQDLATAFVSKISHSEMPAD